MNTIKLYTNKEKIKKKLSFSFGKNSQQEFWTVMRNELRTKIDSLVIVTVKVNEKLMSRRKRGHSASNFLYGSLLQ